MNSRPGSEYLFTSIKRGDLDGVNTAIAEGVSLNEDRADILPLMFAVREHQVAIAERLIDEGADADAANNFGWTALLEATRTGQMDMVQMMDAYEINLGATSSHGDGLLHAAVQGDTKDMVPFFAKRGVTIDLENRHGVTPVMMAADRKAYNSFCELVSEGADVDKLDRAGLSARQRAETWPEVAVLLANTAVKAQTRKVHVARPTEVVPEVAEAAPARRSSLSGISKRSSGMR